MPITEANGPIKHIKIDATSSFDLVPAVTGKRIRLLSLFMTVTTLAGTVKFQSNATTDLSGPMSFNANGQLPLLHNPSGHFPATAAGEKLNVVLGTTGQVSGFCSYQLID